MVRTTSARTCDPVGHAGKLPRGLEAEEEVPLVTIHDLCPDRTRLVEIARRYSVARLEVFGSFARSDAGPGSDLDLLVTFEPGAEIGLEFVALRDELAALFGRPVDLLTRSAVERSPNKYFRRFALSHTVPLYEPA